MPRRVSMLRAFAILLASLIPCTLTASAQTPDKQKPPDQSDDVLRINTELVQTDVITKLARRRSSKNLK